MPPAPSSVRDRLRAWAERDGRGYPDWCMRYAPVVRRLAPFLRDGARVVEIGANEAGLARFAGIRVTVTDFEHSHLKAAREAQSVAPVQSDIAHLPFADHSVDVLVCLDTFEHLPEDTRLHAIAAIARCLSPTGRAVIAFPSGDAAARAEQRIRAEYRQLTGQPFRWLEEHAVFGLPDAHEIRDAFARSMAGSHSVSLQWNSNAAVWTWTWRVLACAWPGRGNVVFQVILRVLAPLLARCHFGRCYRAMIWLEPRLP